MSQHPLDLPTYATGLFGWGRNLRPAIPLLGATVDYLKQSRTQLKYFNERSNAIGVVGYAYPPFNVVGVESHPEINPHEIVERLSHEGKHINQFNRMSAAGSWIQFKHDVKKTAQQTHYRLAPSYTLTTPSSEVMVRLVAEFDAVAYGLMAKQQGKIAFDDYGVRPVTQDLLEDTQANILNDTTRIDRWISTYTNAMWMTMVYIDEFQQRYGRIPGINWINLSAQDLGQMTTGLWAKGGKLSSPIATPAGYTVLDDLRHRVEAHRGTRDAKEIAAMVFSSPAKTLAL